MEISLPSEIQGSRVILVSPPPEEFDLKIANLLSNQSAMTYLTAMSKADVGGWTLQDAVDRRCQQEKDQADKKGWFCVILEAESRAFVGICGLRAIDWYNRAGEMGIIIDPSFWGLGYSVEAHLLVMDYSFQHLNLHRIFFITASGNEAMRKFLAVTLAACHEGTLRDKFARSWTDPAAGYDTTEMYSVLAPEWPSKKVLLEEKLRR